MIFLCWCLGSARSTRWHIFHYFKGYCSRYHTPTKFAGWKIHTRLGQRRFLWWKSTARVRHRHDFNSDRTPKTTIISGLWNICLLFLSSDDLRTANIICDSEDGVTCLVIDRETFKQSISNLDEIRNKYNDEGTLERKR